MLRACRLAFIAVAGLLTACSSDDDNTVGGDSQSPEAPIRIEVEVNEEPMVDASDQARETRGEATTTATLSGFKMYAVNNASTVGSYGVSKSNNTWTISPGTWPSGNNPVDFYANTGGTFNLNGGHPYVRFEVAENASTQHDLLVAKKMQQPRPTDGVGKVSLTFSHACAAVAFRVYITNTLKERLKGNLTVNSIVLRNVYNDGKYYFNSGWNDVNYVKDNNDQPVKTYYTLTNSSLSVGILAEVQDLSSNDIFVIPQTRTANGTEDMYLEISYTFTGQKNNIAIIPLGVTWETGMRYTYDIKLGTTLIQ